MGQYYLPKDPLQRFAELYHALNADRGWWQDASCLRFAAVAATTCPGSPQRVADAIRIVADEIQQRAGWFGELKSPLRFIVSAVLVCHRDSAEGFLNEVTATRAMFREVGLRRGGIYETMAILMLRIAHQQQPISYQMVERFRGIYDQMKKYHWWLTGANDYPACAVLVSQPGSTVAIGTAIEEIYQQLNAVGFKRGDPLQTAANLLYLSQTEARTVANRFRRLADGFRDQGARIWQNEYDELAILSFLKHTPEQIVDRVLDSQRAIRSLKPKPDRSLAFNLASSLVFLELVQMDEDLKELTDAKALLDMQAIIAAQQAAAACAAASAACAASASSGSS